MRDLISTRGNISQKACDALASISAREFFEGDLEVEPARNGHFQLGSSLRYPVALTHLSASDCTLGYRRTLAHIRRNQVGFRVIWFVRKGSLQVTRSRGTNIAVAGQATFIDSNTPFHVKALGDANGEFESFQLKVPAYLFFQFLQEADRLSRPLDLSHAEATVIWRIVSLLSQSGDDLNKRIAASLAETLLAAVAHLLEQQSALISRAERLNAERFAEFREHIEAGADDPLFSLESAAKQLSVSARYLCYVLRANDTSFSRILWKGRLRQARDRLSHSGPDCLIEQIARSSGFKSAAHFSRLFKAEFAISPSAYQKMSSSITVCGTHLD